MSKTVIITGGTKRIGLAIAQRLAKLGYHLALVTRKQTKETDAALQELKRQTKVVVIEANLSEQDVSATIFKQATAAFGSVDYLVNNASIFEYDNGEKVDALVFKQLMQVNLLAPIQLAQALAVQLPVEKNGAVVNILDQKIFNPNPDYLSYTLTKHALQAATTLLAQSLAPKVRMTAVAPGLSLPSGDQTLAQFERAHQVTPLGRASTPADIAAAVVFLLESQAITGEVITVDGGQHLMPLARDVMFLTR